MTGLPLNVVTLYRRDCKPTQHTKQPRLVLPTPNRGLTSKIGSNDLVADIQPTTVPCAPVVPHPRAASGYGKRSAPDQARPRSDAFSHLPEREAFLAAFIDRLPDGAAMDVKTLAAAQPRYGQQAVRSALTHLSTAGHLRRVQETVGNGRSQWVYRTYFTRTARDDTWWHRFLTGATPPQVQPDERPQPARPVAHANPRPAPPAPSPAYAASPPSAPPTRA